MIYTVTFNPAIDYVVHLNGSLKLGDINRNVQEEYQYGGKGINVSNVLRTLGFDNVALGFVAGFTGQGLEDGLKGMGLQTRFIHVEQGMTRVNVKVKAAEETEINGIGPVITEADMEKLYAQLDGIERGIRWCSPAPFPTACPAIPMSGSWSGWTVGASGSQWMPPGTCW